MDMTIDEARELLISPIWPRVRDYFISTGTLAVYPEGDLRRLEYLDAKTKKVFNDWCDAINHANEWRTIVNGDRVREIKANYPNIYPEVFQYMLYFPNGIQTDADKTKLLMLKFPEVYQLCYS